MSIGLGVTRVFEMDLDTTSVGLDSTGDKVTWTITKPVNVIRFGFIVDSSTGADGDVVVALDKLPTAGDTSTDRSELANFTPGAAVDQGEGVYHDLTSREEVNPGEQLVIEVTTADTAVATARVFIEVVEYPFQHTSSDADEDRLANMTEVT